MDKEIKDLVIRTRKIADRMYKVDHLLRAFASAATVGAKSGADLVRLLGLTKEPSV